jgi:hypothetical protein
MLSRSLAELTSACAVKRERRAGMESDLQYRQLDEAERMPTFAGSTSFAMAASCH